MANAAKSIERAKTLAAKLFMPPLCEPAANKYTKVDPCLKSVALITWTFGLLRKAIGARLKKTARDDPGHAAVVVPDQVDIAGAIGIPRDEYAYYRQIGHIKLGKSHTFCLTDLPSTWCWSGSALRVPSWLCTIFFSGTAHDTRAASIVKT